MSTACLYAMPSWSCSSHNNFLHIFNAYKFLLFIAFTINICTYLSMHTSFHFFHFINLCKLVQVSGRYLLLDFLLTLYSWQGQAFDFFLTKDTGTLSSACLLPVACLFEFLFCLFFLFLLLFLLLPTCRPLWF